MQSQSPSDPSEDTDSFLSSRLPEDLNEGHSSVETPGVDQDVLEEFAEDMEVVLSSASPEDINEAGRRFNVETPGPEQDEEIIFHEEPAIVDFQHLMELTNYSDKGNSQLTNLVKDWEYKQENAVRLLRKEIDSLNEQQHEAELKKLTIQEHQFEKDGYSDNERPVPVLDVLEEVAEDMEVVLSSAWPEDINEAGRRFNVEMPGADRDMLEEVTFNMEPNEVDFQRLMELTNYSDKGNWQLANLVKDWEFKQENAIRLLREELDGLNKQQHEAELKKLTIQEHRFETKVNCDNTRPDSVLDEKVEIDAEYDSGEYWKQRALHLENLLEDSLRREQVLVEKLQESVENLKKQSTPVEELAQVLKREDSFLHFVLQNAPVVIGHQDKELRYRFIFNHFPSLRSEDIIGKTDVEIFTGSGVQESQDFKREVLERGIPAKREITFATELFGSKTFLFYVEPVFSKAGETIGVNYMGMDMTDQVRKREKLAKLREEIAVQKAKEMELNKTTHIQEQSMQAKHMLATMSQEIRSPLCVFINMAEVFWHTKLDKEQKQLLKIMLSSGDHVLQLINDILYLSKVDSGVMKLETTKFRPREVVKHVLQTASASLQKSLTLEGHIADDIPIQLIGDVLRLRQILTNLISNSVKFTDHGKVGVKLYIVPEPRIVTKQGFQNLSSDQSTLLPKSRKESSTSQCNEDQNGIHESNSSVCVPNSSVENEAHTEGKESEESVVWIACDVYDTGIGIPENAMNTLFKKYMQAGADTARKYGGTGLGLAICKQLVELMGGHLSVSSVENQGSTFTFLLPYRVPSISDSSDDLSDMENQGDIDDRNDDDLHAGTFVFHPRTLGLSPSSQIERRAKRNLECSSSNNLEILKDKPTRKILLVEDNKINVMVAKSMMKQFGHTIDVVYNGAEAVKAVQRDSYDLVLMDVFMPMMGGLQATRLIRSYEETGSWDNAIKAGIELQLPPSHSSEKPIKRLPIVAMSVNIVNESADECYADTAEECYANGMDSFVSKPIDFQSLEQCLKQYLTKS